LRGLRQNDNDNPGMFIYTLNFHVHLIVNRFYFASLCFAGLASYHNF